MNSTSPTSRCTTTHRWLTVTGQATGLLDEPMGTSALSFHPRAPTACVSQLGDNRVSILYLDRRAVIGGCATQLEPDISVLLPSR